MLIESLAQKTRLAMMTVFAVIGGCTVIGESLWLNHRIAVETGGLEYV